MRRTRHILLDKVLAHATSPMTETAIPRTSLSMLRQPGSGMSTVHAPVACLILQGAKQVTIGDVDLHYDSTRYFMASLDLPATGRVVAATPDMPYVAVGLALDRPMLAELIASVPAELIDHGPADIDQTSFAVSPVTPDLLDAWAALLSLLDRPEDIATLAPAREREVLYRLLRGPLGGHLCRMAQEDGRLARICRAIGWIRDHYDQPLRVVTLADIAGMSAASFHRHFRAATAMSPLQYQKALRLHNARRHLAAGVETSQAAYAVGYESASQFSREYRRSFGLPPSRDAENLRGQVAST